MPLSVWGSRFAVEQIATLLASAGALPCQAELGEYLEDVSRAEARGYYLPDEDERVRAMFCRYLAIRSSLHAVLDELSRGRWAHRGLSDLREFAVAYGAACLLVRAAGFLIDLTEGAPVTRRKLDEPESRYGLQAKSFTRVYQSLTSPRRWWAFFDAFAFYQKNRQAILELGSDSEMQEVVALLQVEEGLIQGSRQDLLRRRFSYRVHSFLRRNHSGYRKTMFGLFRLSGSSIAEMKQPFVKPFGAGKRVDRAVRDRLESFLLPGDVVITRHDDALSNLFLPGYWPHAAFYIGSNAQRGALGLKAEGIGEEIRFLESKRDGVRLRPADDTLQVDALVVLRPRLEAEQVAEAITRGLTHAGKLYDFIFNFAASDRLACTELVYRSYHAVGPVQLELKSYAGRHCLSAEELINQCVQHAWFDPVLVYGLDGDEWSEGSTARERLRGSFAASFD